MPVTGEEPTKNADPDATTSTLESLDDVDRPSDAVRQTQSRFGVELAEPAVAQTERGSSRTPPPLGPTEPAAYDDDAQILVDRDEQLDRQEHASAVLRMRSLLPLAIVLWLGFFCVDWVLATYVVPSPILPYLGLRLIGVVPIAIALLFVRRTPIVSRATLSTLDVVMTSSCAGLLTGMCLLSGGLTSPYNAYVPMVLMGRAAVLPNHFKQGVVRLGIPALLNPIVLAVGAAFSPAVAAQFSDPMARGTFFFYLMLISGAWILLVIGGHNVWAIRRQLFASRSIGRYRLKERIGRGGMGEVWIAYHDQLKRDVALKILRPEGGTNQTAVARFEREVMATAGLSHPNTIRIFDHGVTEDGLWYYAMELLEGRDLGSLVRREGPLEPMRAMQLVRQAGRALAEAHDRGIIHRDLKPENLFITTLGGEADIVKVLDFGIAKVEDNTDARLTTTGFVAGTPAYISPEVASGMPAQKQSDVYGLAATLYYAVTGTPPFWGDNAREVFLKHLEEPPEPPSKRLGKPLPAVLEQVILQGLAKKPEQRFADAGELTKALDRCRPEGVFSTDRYA